MSEERKGGLLARLTGILTQTVSTPANYSPRVVVPVKGVGPIKVDGEKLTQFLLGALRSESFMETAFTARDEGFLSREELWILLHEAMRVRTGISERKSLAEIDSFIDWAALHHGGIRFPGRPQDHPLRILADRVWYYSQQAHFSYSRYLKERRGQE